MGPNKYSRGTTTADFFDSITIRGYVVISSVGAEGCREMSFAVRDTSKTSVTEDCTRTVDTLPVHCVLPSLNRRMYYEYTASPDGRP